MHNIAILNCAGTARPHGLHFIQQRLGGRLTSPWVRIPLTGGKASVDFSDPHQLFTGANPGVPSLPGPHLPYSTFPQPRNILSLPSSSSSHPPAPLGKSYQCQPALLLNAQPVVWLALWISFEEKTQHFASFLIFKILFPENPGSMISQKKESIVIQHRLAQIMPRSHSP